MSGPFESRTWVDKITQSQLKHFNRESVARRYVIDDFVVGRTHDYEVCETVTFLGGPIRVVARTFRALSLDMTNLPGDYILNRIDNRSGALREGTYISREGKELDDGRTRDGHGLILAYLRE